MALATNSTPGSIVLAGDLTGTANTPQLRITGVVPGSYTATAIIVDDKGRVLRASSGSFDNMDGDVSGTYNGTSFPSVVLDNTTVSPGAYTYSNITVDAKGRVTLAVSNNTSFTFSGDISGPISATSLASSGVSAGSYSNPTITVDSKGRITSASSGASSLSGDVTGAFGSNTLTSTGVTAGSYTNANITVDAKGRVTATSNSSAQLSGDVTGFPNSTSLSLTGVTAGSYVPARITVNSKGRITSASDSLATTTQKGILTIQENQGLALSGTSELTMIPAENNAFGGVVPLNTNISAVSGSIDVGTNVVKFDTGGQFTKAYGVATYTAATGPLTPDLSLYNSFILGNQSSSPSINTPLNTATGKRFTITIAGLPLSGSGSTGSVPSASNWTGHAYNGSIHVICGASGTNYATSTDGLVWTSRTGAGGYAVVWTGSVFCMVGRTNSYVSTDGLSWTTGSTSMTSTYAVTWNGTSFVAIGSSTAWVSTDGLSWTSNSLPFSNAVDVVWNGTYFFALGSSQVARSSDGSTWTVLGNYPASMVGNSIAVNNTGVIMVGASSTTNVTFSSDNGSSWTSVQTGDGSFEDVMWTGSYWVALVNGSTVDGLFYSNTGATWTQLYTGVSAGLVVGVQSPTTLVMLSNSTTTNAYRVTVTTSSPSFSASYRFSNTIQRNTNVIIDCTVVGSYTYCTYL